MSLHSTRQKETEALLNDWARADTEARCPMGRHEYCADSNRGRTRKRMVASKQNRSNNRKANFCSKHNIGFKQKLTPSIERAEQEQIADYARSTGVKKRINRMKARQKRKGV